MILKKAAIIHMVESVVAITKCKDLVLIGSGALIATAKTLPATLMMTNEVDVYARDARDPDDTQDLIEGTLGAYSQFRKTYEYHVDAVTAKTAVLPEDWTKRAKVLRLPRLDGVTVTCPDPNDLALAKLVAWREKDVAWLKECMLMRIIEADSMKANAQSIGNERLQQLDLLKKDILTRIDLIAPLARPPRGSSAPDASKKKKNEGMDSP